MTYILLCSNISERIRSEMFASLDPYLLRIEASSIPVNATKIYSIFRRSWFTSGAALYTEIISFIAEN